MDTSKTYIKMCERAEEIQSIRTSQNTYKAGFGCGDIKSNIWFDSEGDFLYMVDEEKSIWLPRQDQLQEMLLAERYEEKYDLCSIFAAYLLDKPDIMSMEQLWLAFVMKEKYNKSWNGTDWELNA